MILRQAQGDTSRQAQGQPEPRRGSIDLHLHTTASDGRCSPAELVDLACAAGLSVMAVTDHDTTAGIADARAHAADRPLQVIQGIEVTAVENGADVHVLGYFIDPEGEPLQEFLVTQRATRVTRVEQIGARLAELGRPIDLHAVMQAARLDPSRAIGRPQVARAMIAAGHVATLDEAFGSWLGRGCPAFVPRTGASPEQVIRVIHAAGGIASLAHPGRTQIDARIPMLREAGLDALEAFHPDHPDADRHRYTELADTLGLLVTGGSDFHGDPARPITPGSATLPSSRWDELVHAASSRHDG